MSRMKIILTKEKMKIKDGDPITIKLLGANHKCHKLFKNLNQNKIKFRKDMNQLKLPIDLELHLKMIANL